MKAYNVQPIATDNLTGIGNYAAEILKCLLKNDEDYELHVFNFLGRNNARANVEKFLGGIDETKLHVVKSMPLSAYIRLGKAGQIIPYDVLTASKADINVFFNYLAPQGIREKYMITIYDMVCERFPETMDNRNRKLLQRHLKKSADNASAVITISEFSKNEIMEILGVPEEKIYVAPCGIDTNYYCPSESISKTNEEKDYLKEKWELDKYILYVGTLEPRKNTGVLVKAFNEIAKDNPDVKLVLAGGLGWHPEQTLSFIEDSEFKDRIIRTGYISNEEKRMLLRNCGVFCFPSLYEGFGMPVTEAMACGAPCVISNTSSLPEVSKNLLPMASPDDYKDFAIKINDALTNGIGESRREEYIKAAASFSWEASAEVYKEAIKHVYNI